LREGARGRESAETQLGTIAFAIACALALGCGSAREEDAGREPSAVSSAWIDPEPQFREFDGFWSAEQARAILDETQTFEVSADTSRLTDSERRAVERLIEAGEIFDSIYRDSLHPQSRAVDAHLRHLEVEGEEANARLSALRQLYDLFQGPIAVDLEGDRVAFAPVVPYEPGRNVYPTGATAEAIEAWASSHPRGRVLDVRTLVRRRTRENVLADRATLGDHPVLAVLHPGLHGELRARANPQSFYAIPYALAYAEENLQAYALLRETAELVRADDSDLADYIEQRARDLLSNDYEAGDAAWTSGRFRRLNVQIGAYEPYDDHLLGQKAFYSMSILARSEEDTAELERALELLPALSSALPGGPYERVRTDLPIGIYDVIADFGQARGRNTATVLPNEEHIVRRYGRTILIRRNILLHPESLGFWRRRWDAVMSEAHAGELTDRANFDRTVFHEIGHYLGPGRTTDGRTIPEAMGPLHSILEELKADLISLWLAPRLVQAEILTDERKRAMYASGVHSMLVRSQPDRTMTYPTMQLVQQRWFFDRGVLRLEDGRLSVDYARYPQAVETLLAEVLRLQRDGDREAAEAFVARWTEWDPNIQGAIGAALASAQPRYFLVSYPALD
jgi:hypothetical protein